VIYLTETSVDFHRTTQRYIPEYREFFIVTAVITSNQMITSLNGIVYILSPDKNVSLFNMSAPLIECIKDEQRFRIRFLFSQYES
jgi:hypothetical protein